MKKTLLLASMLAILALSSPAGAWERKLFHVVNVTSRNTLPANDLVVDAIGFVPGPAAFPVGEIGPGETGTFIGPQDPQFVSIIIWKYGTYSSFVAPNKMDIRKFNTITVSGAPPYYAVSYSHQ